MIEKIVYRPIGVIHSPFTETKGTPIQARVSMDNEATAEVFEEFADGLKDLDGFSHIILIFHFHRSRKARLHQVPFMDDTERGVFSIRSPSRPNPIGLSIVRLVAVEGNSIRFRGVDMLEGTPLLDIKPFVPEMDGYDDVKTGWLKKRSARLPRTRDDGRFERRGDGDE